MMAAGTKVDKDINRAELNTVLFDFDSIMDIKVGVTDFVKQMVLSGALSDKFFDMEIIKNSDRNFFKQFHASEMENVFYKIFNKNEVSEENANSIYRDTLSKNHEEIINKYSPVTTMAELIQAYDKTADKSVKTTVLCKSEDEKLYIEHNFPDIAIYYSKREDADISEYTRIVVSDIMDIKKFKNVDAKQILVLAYADNFEVIHVGKSETPFNVLKPSIIMSYGTNNEFEVADPYNKVFVEG